ncbi:hypothetical protein [Ralstonia solanacearum]|uniref:Uncharacterized protein n=1 Tax=Ralstonia solanacearum TaxID=305 RepID=A0AAD0WFU9_RALSL|nr:hypothetical protein [Ralstonia solanacearum]AXV81379.1 hypothetical protein CJO77_07310 [Ralstonia solanacearum]AXW52515.1 hypothetical protein CJO92_07305 [Ralstonia solanacearum]
MGTISERTDNKGAATFQAKVRRKGFPPLSQTFPTRDEAERWMLAIEAELRIRSPASAAKQARAKLDAALTERPRIVADLLNRYLVEETPKKKGATVETYRIRAMLDSPLARVHLTNLRAAATSGLSSSLRWKRVCVSAWSLLLSSMIALVVFPGGLGRWRR